MSDKSFGDHTNRNIVKNPLLSSAVTGLSLEDLTHKAVLLPVTPSLDQITRSDQQQGSEARTLAHPKHETSTFPSGDALSNILLSESPQNTKQNVVDSKKYVKIEETRNTKTVTQSKASAKSDDDFDVNEYIARLQGSRYVSAPLHSHLKEDQNVNLEATEENLEEINLNETIPVETQQSLTADIAQNFSQLPTVLPHVASAVFSSFSNMLSYKSKEQTPDHSRTEQMNKGGFDDVQFQRPDSGVPLMGVEEYKGPKEVAPPPKEPPIGGTSSFRIATKKKYAQIPGLSSGDAAQTMSYPPAQNIPPVGHNVPPIGQNMPPLDQNMPPLGQNMPPIGQNVLGQSMSTVGQNMPPFGQSITAVGQIALPIGQTISPIGQNWPPDAQNMPPIGQSMPPISQNIPLLGQSITAVGQNAPSVGLNTPKNQELYTQNMQRGQNMPPLAQNLPNVSESMLNIGHNFPVVGESGSYFGQTTRQSEPHLDSSKVDDKPKAAAEKINIQESNLYTQQAMHNVLNPATETLSRTKSAQFAIKNQPNLLADGKNFFTPVEYKKQNIPPNQGSAAIIPPPPMFSNIPKRDDSQTKAGKSVLPPSVARRITANQTIIKPAVSVSSFTENIFVPPMPDVPEITQTDNVFSSGFSSAFVSGYNSSSKLEPIGPASDIPALEMNVPFNIPLVDSAPYFIPSSKENHLTSTEAPFFFTPKETGSVATTSGPPSSNSVMATPNLQPAMSFTAFPPVSSYGSTTSNLSPSSFDIGQKNAPPPIFQPPPQNIPPTFFNPLQAESSLTAPRPITQMLSSAIPDPSTPIAEPPKATGNVNFRLSKKRPQYYAGPIDGVGAISNKVKPLIAPIMPPGTPIEIMNFQGGLFVPEQPIQPAVEPYATPEHASVPFDISRLSEQSSEHAAFDISKTKEHGCGTSFNMEQPQSHNYNQEYNTPFDMSRVATDPFNQPKQESIGFGIIGSLKSKLSSIDINKIQSTVTTFFDPGYNDTKVAEPVGQDNSSYHQQQQFGPTSQAQSSFDIFVPNVEQEHYRQFSQSYDYSHNTPCEQTQVTYLQNQGHCQNVPTYSKSSYFTDPNYSTEQVYSNNPLYDNTPIYHSAVPSYNAQENIPEKVETLSGGSINDNTTFYDPNATHENMTKSIQHSAFDITHPNTVQANVVTKPEILREHFDPAVKPNVENVALSHSQLSIDQQKTNSVIGSKEDSNMTYYNPNAFAQENRQIWEPQESHDNFASFSKAPLNQQKATVFASASEKYEPVLYNPNAFDDEIQHVPKTQHFKGNILEKKDLTSNVYKPFSEFQIQSQPFYDSALNTSKYKILGIPEQQNVPPNVPLLPAASFFDNPTNLPYHPKDIKTDINTATKNTQPAERHNDQFEHKIISKPLADMPTPIGIKSQDKFIKAGKDNKDIRFEKEQQVRASNLIESLSKVDIPVLAVSTVPLFGLSAMIADKSKEVSEMEMQSKVTLFSTKHPQSLYEDNKPVASVFENKKPENKIISESQVKNTSLNLTSLSIDDLKNVLLIEPPQENIGELLKRNASSSKLENLPEKPLQHFKQLRDDSANTTLQENTKIKANKGTNANNTTEIIFKHSDVDKKVDNSQKISSADEEQSELKICETCREINTPDHERKHKETEDLTSQLIENITSQVQLSNPLTALLKENDAPIVETSPYDFQQLDEITHAAEETIEILHMQSAAELLDNRTISEVRDYGWTTEENVYPGMSNVDQDNVSKIDSDALATKHDYNLELDTVSASNIEYDYEFKLDPNALGFSGNNSLFFDNLPVPTNASDEIKAEIKHSHEDVVLPRQMSIPTAPPEEADPKLDETGILDVHSIEQDAKKDFPLEEEFIIEPSTDEFLSTDDDKLEFRERKRSSEDSTSNDTFTNRIERFKKKVDNPDDDAFEHKSYSGQPLSMASYFDTGNFAVESHYRNAIGTMRIPPGFEEEYAKKLSGMTLDSAKDTDEPFIPDTSTQTQGINTPSYCSSNDTKENIIGQEIRRIENETLAQTLIESKAAESIEQTVDNPAIIADPIQAALVFADPTFQSEVFSQNVPSLSDPMNFFSPNVEEPKQAEPEPAEGFSRLASYFSMPPPQPEHSKSFFELSQSQNHYRHERNTQSNQKPFFELSQSLNHYIDDDTKNSIRELMKDLTSPQKIVEQTVKTVNYFTIELDSDIKTSTNAAPIKIKGDELNINKNIDSQDKTKPVKNDSKYNDSKDNDSKHNDPNDNDCHAIMKCKHCRRYIPGVNTKVFIVKTAVNHPSEPGAAAEMPAQKNNDSEKTGNTVNFADLDVEKQAEDSVTVLNEHRGASEYTPVKHHWFYRVDVEEKSVWRGFSTTDSAALEAAYNSPDLNESTLVATDGGRYDVNVMGRLRLAVYWKEKPTNVRRCSWFYKGTTDARYVPYTEPVAEKLENEYRHGVTTGEWHRKMALPNSEMVIMHGPSVMVHFLHSGATDAFTTPPQTASRPRVVRRSHEESEIEESEPSRIDHLLLLCHGVGSACDMRFRSVEEVVEDFRATSLQLLQSHYRNSYDNGLVSRVEVLPISWHEQLHSGETGVDRRLARVTLDSIPRLRAFTNHTVLDVLFYTSPVFHQSIISTVCSELNRVYSMFRERNPQFGGEVSLGGHSLGSVILYDLLCHQSPEPPLELVKVGEKCHVAGASRTGQPVDYPQLVFPPAALYALGSPIAIFECIRGVDTLGMEFKLPTCKHFFNIFHPYDPIAYRIEPLINPQLQGVKPSQIPHHKGRKRMHLELKDTMARVGADLKQKLIESLRTTWNKWKASPPPDGQLEKVVEEELEKEQLTSEEEPTSEVLANAAMLGQLNGGRRVDYVLQEAPLEMINEYLFAMSSHVGYWESEDTMLLMLREIYDAMGVQPDSTLPQQTMTVQRTKTAPQDETGKPNESGSPSTSRGGT